MQQSDAGETSRLTLDVLAACGQEEVLDFLDLLRLAGVSGFLERGKVLAVPEA